MDSKFIAIGIGLIIQAGGIVWWASNLQAKVNHNQYLTAILKKDVEQNSDFRVRWPRGQLGSLPDDAEQNQRLKTLEKEMNKVLTKLYNGDHKPKSLTS